MFCERRIPYLSYFYFIFTYYYAKYSKKLTKIYILCLFFIIFTFFSPIFSDITYCCLVLCYSILTGVVNYNYLLVFFYVFISNNLSICVSIQLLYI